MLRLWRAVMVLVGIVVVSGCGTTVGITKDMTRQLQTGLAPYDTGKYLEATTYSGDVDAYFTYDADSNKLEINRVVSSKRGGDIANSYRENQNRTDVKYQDCVRLSSHGKYTVCDAPKANDDQYLSVYHEKETHIATGISYSIFITPLRVALMPLFFLAMGPKGAVDGVLPTFSSRYYSQERIESIGSIVDRELTRNMEIRLAAARVDQNPEDLESFYSEFSRHPHAGQINDEVTGKYRSRGEKNKATSDFINAYKRSNDRRDIQAAQKYAKDDHAKAEVEGVLVSGFPNKHKLVTATVYNDNLKGSRQSQGANVFIMNIGASAIKNAEIGVKIVPAPKSPIPFQYSDYKVKLKCNLKLSYSVAAMGATTNKVENRTQQEEVILRKDDKWKLDQSCSFGEIVQSGGGSLFGFKYMDIHLTGAEASAEIIDVQPI